MVVDSQISLKWCRRHRLAAIQLAASFLEMDWNSRIGKQGSLLRSRYQGRHATILPTNGCLNPNLICFPLFKVHMKITECTNHALPIVSSETNHVSVVYQFPAQIHRLLHMMLMSYTVKHVIMLFSLHCQVVALYGRLKTKENLIFNVTRNLRRNRSVIITKRHAR